MSLADVVAFLEAKYSVHHRSTKTSNIVINRGSPREETKKQNNETFGWTPLHLNDAALHDVAAVVKSADHPNRRSRSSNHQHKDAAGLDAEARRLFEGVDVLLGPSLCSSSSGGTSSSIATTTTADDLSRVRRGPPQPTKISRTSMWDVFLSPHPNDAKVVPPIPQERAPSDRVRQLQWAPLFLVDCMLESDSVGLSLVRRNEGSEEEEDSDDQDDNDGDDGERYAVRGNSAASHRGERSRLLFVVDRMLREFEYDHHHRFQQQQQQQQHGSSSESHQQQQHRQAILNELRSTFVTPITKELRFHFSPSRRFPNGSSSHSEGEPVATSSSSPSPSHSSAFHLKHPEHYLALAMEKEQLVLMPQLAELWEEEEEEGQATLSTSRAETRFLAQSCLEWLVSGLYWADVLLWFAAHYGLPSQQRPSGVVNNNVLFVGNGAAASSSTQASSCWSNPMVAVQLHTVNCVLEALQQATLADPVAATATCTTLHTQERSVLLANVWARCVLTEGNILFWSTCQLSLVRELTNGSSSVKGKRSSTASLPTKPLLWRRELLVKAPSTQLAFAGSSSTRSGVRTVAGAAVINPPPVPEYALRSARCLTSAVQQFRSFAARVSERPFTSPSTMTTTTTEAAKGAQESANLFGSLLWTHLIVPSLVLVTEKARHDDEEGETRQAMTNADGDRNGETQKRLSVVQRYLTEHYERWCEQTVGAAVMARRAETRRCLGVMNSSSSSSSRMLATVKEARRACAVALALADETAFAVAVEAVAADSQEGKEEEVDAVVAARATSDERSGGDNSNDDDDDDLMLL